MQHSKILYRRGIIKNIKMLTQSQFSQFKLVGVLENIKLFYNALKAINFAEDGIFQWSEEGLKVIVEDSQCIQAISYITKNCFAEFTLQNNLSISFCVNLTVLLDCLSILSGVNCSMKMLYKGEGAPLILVLEQHGDDDLITECSIKTKFVNESLDFSLDDDEVENKVILRCPDFSTLLNDIDKSIEELEIFLSPMPPYFRITTLNNNQSESNVEVAKSSDTIYTFSCKSETIKKYKLSHIKLIMKSINLASKISLRTDKIGLLGIQVMVMSEDNSHMYIEYFISPLVNEDD